METRESKGFFKPNTNITGFDLVIPDVDCCPCCGLRWVYNIGGERWDCDGSDRLNVLPEAMQATQDGKTIDCLLFWNCQRCGYRHKHGVS